MQNTSFDINNAANTLTPFLNQDALKIIGKNYVLNSASSAQLVAAATDPIVFYIVATIPLSQIHDIFKTLPLSKNMYMKLEFFFNTNFSTLFTFTAAGAAPTYSYYTNTGNATCCPYVVSP